MNLSNLLGEDNQFLSRLEDLFSCKRNTVRFSPFLTPRQVLITQSFVCQRQPAGLEDTLLYGGFPEAERQVLGVFPSHQQPDPSLFPLEAVTLRYRQQDILTHRDFLGACLSLLITRESIGDIVPGAGYCTIFALKSVTPVILQELRKVGNTGVRSERGATGEVVPIQEFDELRGTVSSKRLDCFASLLSGISREKGAALIRAKLVQLNYVVETNLSKELSVGDIIVIRGQGKFIVDNIGSPTRKGRLPVVCRKYR